MKTVTVDKSTLLATLKENKKTHEEDYAIAWEAFQAKAAKELQKLHEKALQAKPGETISLHVGLTQPQSHSEDYERAIQMLDWEIQKFVELQEHEFAQFVQDDWDWKRQFVASNSQYTGYSSPSKLQL